jgi:hypothetical protein
MLMISNIFKLSLDLTEFQSNSNLILKFVWKNKSPRVVRIFLEKHEVG